MNQITKVGLSLLIALAFIVPAGAVTANMAESPEAVDNNATNEYTVRRMVNDIMSQAPEDVTVDDILFVPKDSSGNVVGDPFSIVDGATIPNAECYGIILQLTNPNQNVECVIPMADVYTLDDGKEVVMYETSFEDNFDIYNNWIQIDGDCAVQGGYYDTFSWSDARASDGDHSMKSTMYDIYKGKQDDYLQCTQVFDMTDQFAFNVSFDIWVEGEGDYAAGPYYEHYIYDFLSFEYSTGYYGPPYDWNNPDWLSMGDAMLGDPSHDPPIPPDQMFFRQSGNELLGETIGSYYFFDTAMPLQYVGEYRPYCDYTPKAVEIGNGWWHVWYEMPVSYLEWFWGVPMDQMQFRFDWHTDTQFQYEGAYVDNFKVVSIESEQQKIFQAAAQEEICIDPGETIFYEVTDHDGIALDWCDIVNGDYRVFGYTCSTTDAKVQRDFTVGDNIDCAIDNLVVEDSFTQTIIPDGGRMTAGQDAHIMYDFCNLGNVPVENVPITATAKKLIKDDVYSTDFEGLPWSDTGSFDGPSLWHKTSMDAWSGSNSFGFFDKDTMHYENNIDYGYALSPITIDFTDVEDMQLDYYYKAILADDGDEVFFCFSIPTGAYQFFGGMTSSIIPGGVGPVYQPTWVGPDQPQGKYSPYDLKDTFDYFRSIGLGFNGDGSENNQWGFGIQFTSDESGYTNSQAELNGEYWSGVLIDDVTITSRKAGDTVWTDTVILPGPIEPGDCIEGIQFEWEDVPYSHYIIEVCSGCDGDVDLDNNCKDQSILVMDDLEIATDKLVESTDLTCESEGEWGISSSDIDNHFCSNPTTQTYPSNANYIMRLAPTEGVYDGESVDVSDDFPGLIDISHMIGPIEVSFEVWFDLEYGYDYVVLEVADVDNTEGCDPETGEGIADQWTDWTPVMVNDPLDPNVPGWWSPYYFDDWSGYYAGSEDGWYTLTIPDLRPYFDDSTGFMALRFRIVSDSGVEFRGFRFDDFTINGLFDISTITEPNKYADLMDTGDDMDNWRNEKLCTGTNWEAVGDTCFSAIDDTGNPGWEDGVVFNDALTWATEIEDAYEAYLTADVNIQDSLGDWFNEPVVASPVWQSGIYVIASDCLTVFEVALTDVADEIRLIAFDGTSEVQEHSWHDTDYAYYEFTEGIFSYFYVEIVNAPDGDLGVGYTSQLLLEFSADGGENWLSLDQYIFDGGVRPLWEAYFAPPSRSYNIHPDNYDLTPWAGNSVLVRYRYVGACGGDVEICDMAIQGKKDTTAPSSTITMSGTMADSGWYSTPVQCTITATDDNKVKEIHYILDGSETVVAGDSASFTVSGNGAHNLEFWAVDSVGNVETPHNTVPTFRIDSGSPPTVAITAPEPGLYLFGNKLLSLSKVMIIGAFTAEATASDAESGVYRVQFLLDGDVVAEDTEAPFSAYIAEKHMGAGTLSVVAEDFSGNTAEDSLDITYYKFL